MLVDKLEDLADVPIQLRLEARRFFDGGMTSRPQAPMARLEQIQRHFLFAREMLVQRRIRVAALVGDVANARAGETVLAEQLHCGTQYLPLGGRIVFANVEGQHPALSKERLA